MERVSDTASFSANANEALDATRVALDALDGEVGEGVFAKFGFGVKVGSKETTGVVDGGGDGSKAVHIGDVEDVREEVIEGRFGRNGDFGVPFEGLPHVSKRSIVTNGGLNVINHVNVNFVENDSVAGEGVRTGDIIDDGAEDGTCLSRIDGNMMSDD